MAIFGQWGKASAVKWLFFLIAASFLLSLISVVSMVLGLVGAKAQGKGMCNSLPVDKEYEGLGKWDDAPADLHLNWFVCEYQNETIDKPTSASLLHQGWKKFGDSFYRASCGWHRQKVAAKMCLDEGAYLVSINSPEENDFVRRLCGFETCWIGLHEKENSEQWIWPDGTAVGEKSQWTGYTNWYEGEPNNNGGTDESVAFMSGWFRLDMPDPSTDAGECSDDNTARPRMAPTGTGKWFDIDKNWRVLYSICEKPGTPADCAKGGYSAFGNSCYLKHCAMSTFWEADAECRMHGFAGLATITSLGENQHVRRICGLNSCRIGLLRDSEGWQWEEGKRIGDNGWNGRIGKPYAWNGYVNWNEGEPSEESHEDSTVMNINDMISTIRKGMLFSKIWPLYNAWALIEISLPVALFFAVCVASRYHSACFASCIRTTAGMASFWLVALIVIWLYTLSHVNEDWPGGSSTLLVCLSIASVLQLCTCCMAAAKAQELQWATTGPWSSMGTRSVAAEVGNDSGVSLSTDVRGAPASA